MKIHIVNGCRVRLVNVNSHSPLPGMRNGNSCPAFIKKVEEGRELIAFSSK